MSHVISYSPETLPFMEMMKRGADAVARHLWPQPNHGRANGFERRRDQAENAGVVPSAMLVAGAVGSCSPQEQIARMSSLLALRDAWQAACAMSAEMVAADATDAPDWETWEFALRCLIELGSGPSAPLIMPLQMGGVSAEWHENGINLELRFRGMADIYTVVEDANGKIETFLGRDPTLARAKQAAKTLASRCR